MRLICHPQLVPGDGKLHNLRESGRALATGIENVRWRDRQVQLLLCAECYEPGCIDGNYVELRRIPGFVVWTPSPRIETSDEPWRIAPPQRFANLGFPLWPLASWQELAPLVDWPRFAELPPLTWDAARLLAAEEAPPRLRSADEILVTDPWVDDLPRLLDLSSWDLAADAPVVLEPAGSAERLKFIVEHPDEEIALFARRRGSWWPLLRPDLLIIPAAGAAPTAA